MADHVLRQLPAVHQVLQEPAIAPLIDEYGHEAVAASVRATLEACRERLLAGMAVESAQIVEQAAQHIRAAAATILRPVINATGVLLHTNLGRAPLAAAAVEAVRQAAAGYINLELDLETGKRSQRQQAVRGLLCRLLGAESATAVNNCAAATLLVLRTLAAGREVIVSRGQLVEIGGSFRIPEIMQASGAVLREVGATNITRIGDYEQAISPDTALIMHVHQSNYRVRGFASSPAIDELVALGRRRRIAVVDDIGSGALVDYAQFGLPGEPLAAASLAAGADLVLFSGDKLLGGPQAGIVAGRKNLIDLLEKNPLMRAVRLDKLTLAALEATLRLYLRPDKALGEIPVLRQLATPIAELRHRAERVASEVAGEVRDDVTYVGGGSLPDQSYPTVVVTLTSSDGADALARRLRLGEPAVLARVQGGAVLLDMRSVLPDQVELLRAALGKAVKAREE